MIFLITIYIFNIIALMFLFSLIYKDRIIEDFRKKSFSASIILTIIIITAELITILVDGAFVEYRIIHIIFNVIGFSLTPLIPLTIINILGKGSIKKCKIIFIPTIINFIVVVLSPFFNFIFQVDALNIYQRGSLFIIFPITYLINLSLLVTVIIKQSFKKYYPIRVKVLLLTTFALIGALIQMIFPNIYSSWHSITLTLLLLYIILFDFEGSLDPLTRLYNRATFNNKIKYLENKKSFTIIILDINNFKIFNDTYGHDYGDYILTEIANSLRLVFKNDCGLFRIGGDEFCIFCNEVDTQIIDNKLAMFVNDLQSKHLEQLPMPSVAYGYSFYTKGQIMKEVIKTADNNMYKHKNNQ